MRRKILFINGHLNVGGVEKSLVDILKHLDYDRYEVDLLLLEGLGDYAHEIPKEVNIKLCSLKNTYGALLPCLLNCIKKADWFSLKMRLIFLMMKLFGQKYIKYAQSSLTQNHFYDCVIGFRSGICTQIAAFAVNADKRITWWHHGEFNVSAKEYEENIGVCDKVVSVSESCAEMLLQNMPKIGEKLVVVPNMVDTEALEKKCSSDSVYSGNEVHLVTVARLAPEKHIENIIYSAKQLKRVGYQLCWHIVGDGDMKERLEILLSENKVEDCVILEGSKANPYSYMKDATLYVHPSYVESQGLTILEAMALGVPCVVTKSRGPSEFIRNGENGLLVETGWEALCEGVEKMLKDKMLYKKIKDNSKCPEKFSPHIVMKVIENILLN